MKKILTNDVIENDLMAESSKSSIVMAILAVILIGVLVIMLFAIKWQPWDIAIIALIVLVVLGFLKMHNNEREYRNAVAKREFFIKEECCTKKEKMLGDADSRSDYYLYFGNDYPVSVSKKFYNATNEGDMFYVVYMTGDPDPRLHYNQNEWEL